MSQIGLTPRGYWIQDILAKCWPPLGRQTLATYPWQHGTITKIYQKEVNCRSGILHIDFTMKKDDHWWKTNIARRRPLMEDSLWWKTTYDGRQHLVEDHLWRKTAFDGRQPFKVDDLWLKTAFDYGQPLMENDLWRRTALMEDNL